MPENELASDRSTQPIIPLLRVIGWNSLADNDGNEQANAWRWLWCVVDRSRRVERRLHVIMSVVSLVTAMAMFIGKCRCRAKSNQRRRDDDLSLIHI